MEKNIHIAIIYDDTKSDWVSCNSILSNLIDSYLMTGLTITKLPVRQNSTRNKLIEFANLIFNKKITNLVFADYRTNPILLLEELTKLTHQLPKIHIHIYGDFFLKRNLWFDGNSILKNFSIQFICASSAQCNFLKNFLNNSNLESIADVIPFCISDDFSFNDKKRNLAVNKYLQNEDTFVLCYSGRISLQKNVLDILSAFNFLVEFIPQLRLLIAGPFDDIGIPYISLSRYPFTMDHEFFNYIESLPAMTKEKIKYLGNLSSEELIDFYHASDAYISFSSHNDEDFGMAPAEALTSGLPLFLTNWGGFADFKKNMPNHISLIDVEERNSKIKPTNSFKQKILKSLLKLDSPSIAQRKIISDKSKQYYSKEAVSQQLRISLLKTNPLFSGFNEIFIDTVIKTNKLGPFLDESGGFSNLYWKLYDCYFNKGSP